MGRIAVILLDTSALIYWTLAPVKLTRTAFQAIQEAETINVCSISIWELGIKVRKGYLTIPVTLSEYVIRLEETEKVVILPVDEKIWLTNLALGWPHKDPADRTIVAMAQLLGCPLITS
ncbi:MAG TPA: type II toxin-antitoxin system VapC family toxin, partial [Anaerolineae bacterium]|nr:type II toxin-antitoxin system VapC family toxin [Anaerolineae bacterium]